jgi:hypothetical protein
MVNDMELTYKTMLFGLRFRADKNALRHSQPAQNSPRNWVGKSGETKATENPGNRIRWSLEIIEKFEGGISRSFPPGEFRREVTVPV